VLLQSEIVSLLNELLNQDARLRKGGSQAVYFCPVCNHYKRKLEFNLETFQWHCWTCDIKGSNLGAFLFKVNASKNYHNRLFKLTGDIRTVLRNRKPKVFDELSLPEDFRSLSRSRNTPEYRNAMVYLKKRGIIHEDILRYNIGYCENGDYDQHIIIPSYDANAKLNFFMGRRYYNTEGVIPHKKPVASLNIVGLELFINWNEPLNLCEGFFDAIAIRNNAIPLFGKYPSAKLRENMILNKVKRVNMILDNDALGDAVKNCRMVMKLGIDVHLVRLNGKDPSILGFEKINSLINESQPVDFNELIDYELKL